MNRVAILIDGEFMRKELENRLGRSPMIDDFRLERAAILAAYSQASEASSFQLYRIFYYTAEPFAGERTNPLNGTVYRFGETRTHRQKYNLIGAIEREPHVAVRRGVLVFHGWKLNPQVERRLIRQSSHNPEPITDSDIRPNFTQKGVDMRIGLDIATLALKRLVSDIVVVTGDLDMVPAFKLARREGLGAYLYMMGCSGRDQLCVHSDRVIG